MSTQYIRPAEVCKRVGIAPATLWSWCKAKKPGFPQPYRLSPRFTVFEVAELDAFIASTRQQTPAIHSNTKDS